MSGSVKQFVDFTGNTNNDTGENNASSIQPIANGEVVDATVAGRPNESLRQRTEAIRDAMADTLYLRDADRTLVITGPGKVTWPGSTTAAQTGIPVISNVLWILPMLSPGFAQTSPVPPVASAFGVLHLKRSSDNTNAILVTSQRRSFAAGDQINVTVSSGASFSCVLDVETGLRRTIKIVATGATTLGATITALNGLTPPAPDNTQLVVAALEGGALSGDLLLTTQARQLVTGNYDGEGHTITPANLAGFFTSNPTQALAEGDTLCAQFDSVIDTASTGGRRQATPENSNTSIPSASFFNSRVHPEHLVNALPICKVVNGRLVFGTGTEVPAGSVAFDLSSPIASNVTYGGGGVWADGTTNPTTTVETQLDKIISDLGTGTGTAKIQGAVVGPLGEVPTGTLFAQLGSTVGLINDTKNQGAVRLLDGLIEQLTPSDLGSAADPEMRQETPGGDTTGTEWCYVATLGAGIPVQGSSPNILRISAGTVYQRVPSSPQASMISFTLPGTDQFTIANGNGVNPRVDLIQIRLVWSGTSPSSSVTATVSMKTGTPAAVPAYPAPDVGFVPICYVLVGSIYAGSTFLCSDTALPFRAVVHDVRMPLGVKTYVVRPVNMMYHDDAWDLAGFSGDAGTNKHKNKIENKSALTAGDDVVLIPCPAVRGRLIGFALMSSKSNGAVGSINNQSAVSFGAELATISVVEAGATPVFHRAGLRELEMTTAPTIAGITPLDPGGSTPRKAYGAPIWCDGTRWHVTTATPDNTPSFFDTTASLDTLYYVAYQHSNVFNTSNRTRLFVGMFWVAEGLG